MTRRAYRLWDYNVSHSQLLVRALADQDHETNDDLMFAGVAYLRLPETLFDVDVEAASDDELQTLDPLLESFRGGWPETTTFVLRGVDERGEAMLGLVVAETFRRDANQQDQLESSLRYDGPSDISAVDFEKAAIATLASLATPEGWSLTIPRDQQVDAILQTPAGDVVAVEIKHVAGRPPPQLVRRIVTQMVVATERLSASAKVLVILDRADPPFLDELNRHLVTALGSYTRSRAINWQLPDGTVPIAEAVGDLVNPGGSQPD
jgi:hypothetical protein